MRVFVYGTLKKGLCNSSLLRTAEYVGTGYTVSLFTMRTVGFPIIFPAENGSPVFGEVFEVDDNTLKALDNLESEGRMYNREKIMVVLPDIGDAGQIEDVYVYVGNPDYWDGRGTAYTYLNEYDELEWYPRAQ
jgi:gamma-glutamylcyclotransferase (GGCT)/AIG2-like uncharacterized protein YtfP